MSSITVDFSDLNNVTADVILDGSSLEITPDGLKVSEALLDIIAETGVPAGGTTGQVLAKASNADNDVEWVDQTGGGGGLTAVSPTTAETLTYVSNGDTNGVVYRIGTNFGAVAFANPHTAGKVTVVRSSSLAGTDADLVDRAINYNTTDNGSGEWYSIDLGVGRTLIISDYVLQNGSNGAFDHTPRNWKLQGSNNVATNDITGINAATWTDIDTRTNNTTIAQSSGGYGHFILGSVPAVYRWFRLLATGINNGGDSTQFFQVGEFDFYGDFVYGAVFYDGSLTAFQDSNTVKPLDDTGQAPVDAGTIVGWIKFSVGGVDSFLPYYQ